MEVTIEVIRGTASRYFDPKKHHNQYEGLVNDIAKLVGIEVPEETFQLTSDKPKVVIPKRLDDARFLFQWELWKKMRRKMGYSNSDTALNGHLRQLDECDLMQAIDCLRKMTDNTSQGIHNERYRRNVRSDQGGFVQNSVEAAAKRTTEGYFG